MRQFPVRSQLRTRRAQPRTVVRYLRLAVVVVVHWLTGALGVDDLDHIVLIEVSFVVVAGGIGFAVAGVCHLSDVVDRVLGSVAQMWPFPLWALVSLVLPILLLFRALYLVNATFRGRRGRKRAPRLPSGAPCSTLLVLGSGGHTAELLAIMDKLPLETYSPRHYVLASTDRIGADKARDFEAGRGSKWQLHRVPRAREVGQSFVTAIWTTIKALVVSMGVVWTVRPDLVSQIGHPGTGSSTAPFVQIIVNGPGTCVPIVISALLLKVGIQSNTYSIWLLTLHSVALREGSRRSLCRIVCAGAVTLPHRQNSLPISGPLRSAMALFGAQVQQGGIPRSSRIIQNQITTNVIFICPFCLLASDPCEPFSSPACFYPLLPLASGA